MTKKLIMMICLMLAGIGSMKADNTLSIQNLNAEKGSQVVLPILMNNTDDITALSFELHLPQGVSVAKNSKGKFLVQHTDRVDDQSVSSNLSDGVYYVATLSLSKAPYYDNSGAVINITLDIAADAPSGSKTIELKNIVLSTPATQMIKPANASCTLQIKGSDARCANPTITFKNGSFCFSCETERVTYTVSSTISVNGTVSGTDASMPLSVTVNVVASRDGYADSEKVSKTFTTEELLALKGDMNNDGKLSINDVTILVNKLIGKQTNL